MNKKFVVIALFIIAAMLLSACQMLGYGPEEEERGEEGMAEEAPEVDGPVVEEPVAEVEEAPQLSPMEACAMGITLPGEPAYPLLYCEDFESADSVMMPLGEFDSKPVDMVMDVYNGKYTMRATVKQTRRAYITTPDLSVRDFVMQVEGRLASHSGHPYHSWGILIKLNQEDEQYYYFKIDNNQYYYFMLVRGDKETNLINGRLSRDINPLEEGNTLTVVATGDKYEFYINGEYMEEFRDNRLLTGNLGLFFSLSKDTLLDWEFDNLVVYAP